MTKTATERASSGSGQAPQASVRHLETRARGALPQPSSQRVSAAIQGFPATGANAGALVTTPRVLVIGLDCATPQLVFDRLDWRLPTLRGLAARGTYGTLRTITPAITVPAWACMMTGRDPGELGIYGFRNRSNFSYEGLQFADVAFRARTVRLG